MARTDSLGNFLTDVADAIREKKGTAEAIVASDFDTEIASIPSGGGDTPEKGVVFSEWNSDGYPEKAEIKGFTAIPDSYLQRATGAVLSKLKTIVLLNNTTSIGNSFCYGLQSLENINFPSTLTSIGSSAFYNCKGLTELEIVGIHTNINNNGFQNCTSLKKVKVNYNSMLASYVFKGCTGLKKACLPNVTGMGAGNVSNSPFNGCTALKQVWLGSRITTSFMFQYCFYGCNNLEKIYINLPRATVETFTNYPNAFMNNTSKVGIIVCNDDTGFITEAEFDALDPDNM